MIFEKNKEVLTCLLGETVMEHLNIRSMPRWDLFEQGFNAHLMSLKEEKTLYFQGLELKTKPFVYQPGPFSSTQRMWEELRPFLDKQDQGFSSVLEMCCGTGGLALLTCACSNAWKKPDCHYTLADLHPNAVAVAKINIKNTLSISQLHMPDITHWDVIQTDLFDELDAKKFDLIICNAPFFSRPTETAKQAACQEMALTCDSHLFFDKLLNQAKKHMTGQSHLIVHVSNCSDLRSFMPNDYSVSVLGFDYNTESAFLRLCLDLQKIS